MPYLVLVFVPALICFVNDVREGKYNLRFKLRLTQKTSPLVQSVLNISKNYMSDSNKPLVGIVCCRKEIERHPFHVVGKIHQSDP